MSRELCLKLIFILKAFVFHSFLTFRTRLPTRPWTLIAATMYVDTRKDFHNFVQNILKKGDRFIIACTNDVSFNSPLATRLEWTSVTRILRIPTKKAKCMARHLNLRNDSNGPHSCILNYLPCIYFAIIERLLAHPQIDVNAKSVLYFLIFLYHSKILILKKSYFYNVHYKINYYL